MKKELTKTRDESIKITGTSEKIGFHPASGGWRIAASINPAAAPLEKAKSTPYVKEVLEMFHWFIDTSDLPKVFSSLTIRLEILNMFKVKFLPIFEEGLLALEEKDGKKFKTCCEKIYPLVTGLFISEESFSDELIK